MLDCTATYCSCHRFNSRHTHLGVLCAVLYECHLLKICLLLSVHFSGTPRVHLTLRFLYLGLV